MKVPSRYNTWVISLSYAVGAVVLGLGFPRLEVRSRLRDVGSSSGAVYTSSARRSSAFVRPADNDQSGLAIFEQRLAQILLVAFKELQRLERSCSE